MLITFVTHQYPPHYNTGTELYAKRLALKIRGVFGYDVRIFTFEPSYQREDEAPSDGLGPRLMRREETVDEGVPVTRVWAWPGLAPNAALATYYNVFLGKQFGTYLDQVKPDLVHFFHTAFLGSSLLEEAFLRDIPAVVNLMDFWFVCPTAQLLRTRTMATCSGPQAFDCLECVSLGNEDFERLLTFTRGDGFLPVETELTALGRGMRFSNPSPHAAMTALGVRAQYLQEVLRCADAIVAPSTTLRDVFVRQGLPADAVRVLRYGVDPMPPYAFDKRPTPALRFGFIGSINKPKGLHLLVDAMRGVNGDCSLDIYGNPASFPHYSQACFEEAFKDPRIRIRGAMKPEHAPTALRDVDVLVVPSLWHENTPFVVLEARAAGVPVLGAGVGGIAEIVHDGRDGRLFEAGDVDSLRAVMQELVDDRAQVARLSGHFADVRTLLANAREFDDLYHELLARYIAPRAVREGA